MVVERDVRWLIAVKVREGRPTFVFAMVGGKGANMKGDVIKVRKAALIFARDMEEENGVRGQLATSWRREG